jgi:hypothetical protein
VEIVIGTEHEVAGTLDLDVHERTAIRNCLTLAFQPQRLMIARTAPTTCRWVLDSGRELENHVVPAGPCVKPCLSEPALRVDMPRRGAPVGDAPLNASDARHLSREFDRTLHERSAYAAATAFRLDIESPVRGLHADFTARWLASRSSYRTGKTPAFAQALRRATFA